MSDLRVLLVHIFALLRFATVALTLLLCTMASAATLQQQLEQAVSAFSQGDYEASYWQFESMALDYGSEPEFLARTFQQTILPVRGYAALMADRPTDALTYFGELLQNYDSNPRLQAFVFYNTAIAQTRTQALAAAADTFRVFQQYFPNSNEAALARLQEANLHYQMGDSAKANNLLDDCYQSTAPESLRLQARLRALQIAGENGSTERARTILFNSEWNVAAMPEIAVLSFAALDIGDLLLSEGHYTDAVRAYRLTLPRAVLIERQRAQLRNAEIALNQSSLLTSEIWKSHCRQLIARLQRQLLVLETMTDYTPGLYLRSGQAYLLGQRYREATILLRTVAQSESFETDIRAEAHYRWIIACSEAGDWQNARTVAQQFIVTYPSHTLANRALFLIARTFQSEGQFLEAIAVLDDLIEYFPDDKHAPRWYFTRGHNYSALEQQASARNNFETALQRYPNSNLSVQLKLWHGLTFFFERNYDSALQELLSLKKKTHKHPLYPEINYRIATIYYAQQNYSDALKTVDRFINKNSDHQRFAAAQVLRGDILMGLGELTPAAMAFCQVSPDNAPLYDYAIFQAAKIYKALERYDLLRTHLQTYIDRNDASQRPRVSEALYWIGWSLQQEQRGDHAFPLFEDALTRFGNDPKARAIGSILSAYAELYQRVGKTDRTLPAFDVWLQEASEQSLTEGRLTWFARLTLFKSQRQRTTHRNDQADATLLSIHRFVPIAEQDAETLASVGLALLRGGYDSADDYCEQLLIEYPQHFERATAYYGKAQLAANADHLTEARRWLLRFLEETPTHRLAIDVRLLTANILTQQGVYDGARTSLHEILQIKTMRGRPHARALAGLAGIETELENPKRAIPYWQRIYTLYRAYPEIIIDAYWQSALLFEQIGDVVAARNTLCEMLSDERLEDFEMFTLAQAKLSKLDTLVKAQSELAIQATHVATEVQP